MARRKVRNGEIQHTEHQKECLRCGRQWWAEPAREPQAYSATFKETAGFSGVSDAQRREWNRAKWERYEFCPNCGSRKNAVIATDTFGYSEVRAALAERDARARAATVGQLPPPPPPPTVVSF